MNTTESAPVDQTASFDAQFALLMGSCSCFIVIVNFLAITTILWDKKLRRSPSNYFVASLALADLIVGLIDMPLGIIYASTGLWFFGPVGCDIWVSIDYTACVASIFHLMAISVDRYQLITNSFRYRKRMTPVKALIVILFLWLVPFLISLTVVFTQNLESGHNTPEVDQCSSHGIPRWHIVLNIVLLLYVPSLVLLVIYYQLYMVALKHKQSIDRGSKAVNENYRLSREPVILRYHRGKAEVLALPRPVSSDSAESKIISGPLQIDSASSDTTRHVGMKVRRVSSQDKAAKTIGIVVGCFLLCWFSSTTAFLVGLFCEACDRTTYSYSVHPWLAWLNSGFNPVIYLFLNNDFRRAFGRIYRCKKCPCPCWGRSSVLEP